MAASQASRGGGAAKKPVAKKTAAKKTASKKPITKWDTSKKRPGAGWDKEIFPGGGHMWVKATKKKGR